MNVILAIAPVANLVLILCSAIAGLITLRVWISAFLGRLDRLERQMDLLLNKEIQK